MSAGSVVLTSSMSVPSSPAGVHGSSVKSASPVVVQQGMQSPVYNMPGSPIAAPAVTLELQLYPRFATVGDYRAEPRCVHPRQWTRDSEVANCACCDERFTFVVRKHHCRICGQIFCNACSTKRLVIQQKEAISYDIRACDSCFADYQQPVIKTHRERIMGISTMSVRGSSFRRFRESELKAVIQFLSPGDMLDGLGRVCRDLYFKCRENSVWAEMGFFRGYVVRGRGGEAASISASAAAVTAAASAGATDSGNSVASSPRNSGEYVASPATQQLSSDSVRYGSVSQSGSRGASPSATASTPQSPAGRSEDEGSRQGPSIVLSLSEAAHPMSIYQAYLHFLERKRKRRYKLLRRRLQEVLSMKLKIAVVGSAGVGKTALVNTFLNNTPFPCGFETTGGRVRLKTYTPLPIGQCGSRYEPAPLGYSQIELVDCGGAPRYAPLLPVYLTGCQCVMVCVNTVGRSGPLSDRQICGSITRWVERCAPHCTADTIFIACVVRLPLSEGSDEGSEPEPSPCADAAPGACDAGVAADEEPDTRKRSVSFCSPCVPVLPDVSRYAVAHPRLSAVADASPFTGAGVKDAFRICVQSVFDRDVILYQPPMRSAQYNVKERKQSHAPLDVLMGIK